MAGRHFNILSLSGGGARGLYTARVLAGLENRFNGPIAQHFDLITGTSIGGIIALALAKEIPAQNIAHAFSENMKEIFKPRLLSRIPCSNYFIPKYSHSGLRSLLESDSMLGSTKMGELRHRVVIPAINGDNGSPKVFRSPPTEPCGFDAKHTLVDVALATSAAPVYFPPYEIGGVTYIDGGLTLNAPGMCGYHEATHFIGIPAKDIYMLSITALNESYTIPYAKMRHKVFCGGLYWAKKAVQLAISAQTNHAPMLLGHMLGNRFTQLDELLPQEQRARVAIDAVDESAKKVLISRAEDTIAKAIVDIRVQDFFKTSQEEKHAA